MNGPDNAMLTISASPTTCTRIRGIGIQMWDDPASRSLQSDLLVDFYDNLPESRAEMLEKASQV